MFYLLDLASIPCIILHCVIGMVHDIISFLMLHFNVAHGTRGLQFDGAFHGFLLANNITLGYIAIVLTEVAQSFIVRPNNYPGAPRCSCLFMF